MSLRPGRVFCVALLVPAMLLVGCASPTAQPWSHDGSTKVTKLSERDAARVFLTTTCPVTGAAPPTPMAVPFIGLVIGAVAPLVANFAVSGVKKYIEQAKKDLTATYMAGGSAELIRDDKLQYKCLVVVRGSFGTLAADLKDGPVGSLDLKANKSLRDLSLSRYPGLYMEAELSLEDFTVKGTKADGTEEQKKGQNLVLTPKLLQFASTAARRSDDRSKFIGVIMAISRTALDAKAGAEGAKEKSLAVVPLQFTNIAMGSEYSGASLEDQKRVVAIGAPGERLPAGGLNFSAFVTETEDAGPFYDLMLDSLKSKGDGLEEAIAGALKKLGD